MRTHEERQLLIEVAKELMAALKEISRPVNEICCKLDSEIMQMLPKAIQEEESIGKSEKRSEIHSKAKRACSVCRQPGHRAKNCPRR